MPNIVPKSATEAARLLFRNDRTSVVCTAGMCPGYVQCNLAVIPQKFADDFEEFCRRNRAACPLIYRSACGDHSAAPIAENSDVRTDVALYTVYKSGTPTTVPSLADYDWDDLVTFYVGCSFGLEHSLQAYQIPLRHIEQNVTVAMFKTNVTTQPAGRFGGGSLVVSMRPMPADKIHIAVNASRPMITAHGMPVHVGDGSWIGIDDVSKSSFGGGVQLSPGDVPVFWACGVTGSVAVENAKLDLCFSHSPGSMFITDRQSERCSEADADHVVEVIKFTPTRMPMAYSYLSGAVTARVERLEALITDDPGQRGIAPLVVKGSLLKSALALSTRHRRVAVATGFPCVPEPPYEETDGPPGALAVVRAVQALGAESVTLLCHERSMILYREIVDFCVAEGILERTVSVRTVSAADTADIIEGEVSKFDHLVAVECISPNKTGVYHTMSARDVSDHCSPLDRWFAAALHSSGTMTTCIGDGGNEIGMGNVHDKVRKCIPYGDTIASAVGCDYLITAGVSNWGGYALAACLYALNTCNDHSYYVRFGMGTHKEPDADMMLPSVKSEEKLLLKLNDFNIRDGQVPDQPMSVDGFLFSDLHTNVISAMRSVVGK